MAILVDKNTQLLVQGITGREGEFHTLRMLNYGSNIVAGVTPGKGGQIVCGGRVPVFDTVQEAVIQTNANTSVVFVPARFASDAIIEAIEAGINLIVCITEGIPVLDMIYIKAVLEHRESRLLGPNCPGLLTPGQANIGIMPGHIAIPGPVGVVSRSGTLNNEIVYALSNRGIGQTTCVGVGGDPIIGTRFVDCLELFEKDPQTEIIVLIGEIGGNDEEVAAKYIADNMTKPVVAFIAGQTAPPGKRMGHAGAIIEAGKGTAIEKINFLKANGVQVATHPEEVASIISSSL